MSIRSLSASSLSFRAATRWGAVLLLVLLTGGCVSQAPVPEPSSVPDAPPSVPGSPAAVPDSPATVPQPDDPARAAASPLVLLLNGPDTRELEILQVLSAKLGRPYEVFNLAHRSGASVKTALAARAPVTVIAIGTAAHDLARSVPGLEVLHAGVLRPDPAFRGVDALPPFTVQLDHWQLLAPDLQRLGVIGGPGMGARIAELEAAAADRGLVVTRRIVHSDTESSLAFRAMVPHIDGFVFLPDESVLSPRVIQQILNHGSQNGVQMLVYSPLMYNLGASLYVQPDPVRVAVALIDLLNDPQAMPEITRMRTRSRLPAPLELSASLPTPAAGQ